MSENRCETIQGEIPEGIKALLGQTDELDQEILYGIASGKTYNEISKNVFISPKTIANRMLALTKKAVNCGYDMRANTIASFFLQLRDCAIMDE